MLTRVLFFILLVGAAGREECSCTDICKDTEKELLGQGTWRLLHGIVENVERTEENEKRFKYVVKSLQHLYPCLECRQHLQEMDLEHIEMTAFWVCSFHNEVNKRLKKQLYNCTTLTKYSHA